MREPEEWMREFLRNKPAPTSIEALEQGLRERHRTGWIERGIPLAECENSLEHSNSLGLEVVLYVKYAHPIVHPKDPPLNPKVARRKARHHDYSDDFALDIPPHYNWTGEQKFALEWYAVQKAACKLGALGAEICEDWLDIALRRIPEAGPIIELDKLCTVPRALDYKHEHPELWERKPLGLQDFFPYARKKLTCPALIAIADKLMLEEYKGVSAVQQYHLLLSLGGDIERFDYLMKQK
jgi:5'-deoxynucleotidase YfbR-like HD superfamily hydrolase